MTHDSRVTRQQDEALSRVAHGEGPESPAHPVAGAYALGKDFGGTSAVRSLDFEIGQGEVVGLLGPNGAGKTTTMKLLLGLLKPSRGEAQVLGMPCVSHARAVKERLGYVADEPTFFEFLTGAETIEFVGEIHGVERQEALQRLSPLIERLQFEKEKEALVKTYSHGTKKKLALLTAWVHRPPLLLMDEPTNGLDPVVAARVRDWLVEIAAAGTAVFISTHLLDMAERLCQRFLLLHRGSLVAEGSAAQVRSLAGVEPTATLEEAFLRLAGDR